MIFYNYLVESVIRSYITVWVGMFDNLLNNTYTSLRHYIKSPYSNALSVQMSLTKFPFEKKVGVEVTNDNGFQN